MKQDDDAVAEQSIRELSQEIEGLEKRLAAATALLDRIGSWAHQHGAALCPRGADTYGEGMRDAKQQVVRILSATPSPPAEPAPSLVEQIEAKLRALDASSGCFADCNYTIGAIKDLLRAAREAGGR